jgi:hypothetical protein
MRAIVVELPGPTLALPPVVEGSAVTLIAPGGSAARPVERGHGSLRPRTIDPARSPRDPATGEGEPI